MVGSDALNGALLKLIPERFAVLCVADGWVHSEAGAFTFDIGLIKGQVLGERFRRDDGSGFASR